MKNNITKNSDSKFLSIKQWNKNERPRERLIKYGPEVLSDTELLAIVFGTGTLGLTAIDISRQIMKDYESLENLAKLDYSQLKTISGIGAAKASTLLAAFELSRRIKIEPFNKKIIFTSPQQIADYYIPRFRDSRVEYFFVLLLNSSNQIFREVNVSKGLLNMSLVHPREVFRLAITESAASVILLHNHPSGNPEPSKVDIDITKQLADSGAIIGINVIDHLIITSDNYTSFKKLGYL